MVRSTDLDRIADSGCRSSGGFYYLSKSLFKIKVSETSPEDTNIGTIEVERVPDKQYGYCLDYLGSITSDDTVIVKKNTAGLLKEISSSADDKSKEIVLKAIDTAIELLKLRSTVRAEELEEAKKKSFETEFDPFDSNQLLTANDRLRPFGLCIFLQGGKLSRPAQRVFSDVQVFCNHQLSPQEREHALYANQPPAAERPPKDYSAGILYRPRLPYTLYVLEKQNRKVASSPWSVLQTKVVELENEAPILSIGVDRTFFAKRETKLSFSSGVLTNVEIKKGSELQNFVEIPLTLAQKIVGLPAEIVQLRIDQTTKRAELIDAQTRLINARKSLNQTLNPAGSDQTAEPSSPARRSASAVTYESCFADCQAFSSRDETSCRRSCTCQVNCQGQENSEACRTHCEFPAQ